MKRIIFITILILCSVSLMLGQSKFSLGEAAMKKGNYDQAITYFTEAKKAATDVGTVSLCNQKIAECNKLKKDKVEQARREQEKAEQARREAAARKPSNGYDNGHEWVDLGLSVKWATCNVGASSPSDYGNYYAWGETSTKATYYDSEYKWCTWSIDHLTKYNTKSDYGSVDNRTRLSLSDDAARANWGGHWRMPTKEEFVELESKCTWEWTTLRGVNGYKITGKNGNSIFLPAAGDRTCSKLYSVGSDGNYWSSSLYTDSPDRAWYLHLLSFLFCTSYYDRSWGFSVRPVTE